MRSIRRHPLLVRFAAALLLAQYLVASLGVVPSPDLVMRWFGRVGGERYPCESCGCGCASAKECWTHCCCHSEHQRLTWAIENGVIPPEGVVFRDEQWIAAANAVKPGSAHCGACVLRIKDELRQGIATPRKEALHARDAGGGEPRGKSCCGDGGAKQDAGSSCCSRDKQSSESGPLVSALACKGLQQLLIFALPPASPVDTLELILPESDSLMFGWPQDTICSTRNLDVPAPPPRSC